VVCVDGSRVKAWINSGFGPVVLLVGVGILNDSRLCWRLE